MNRYWKDPLCLLCLLLSGFAAGPVSASDTLGRAIESRMEVQGDNIDTQKQVDSLAESTDSMAEEYRRILDQIDAARARNEQMGRRIARQEGQLASTGRQLENLRHIREGLTPLMVRMVDVLERFVALDLPFLMVERENRIARLRRIMDDPETGIPEKYRRIAEAYQIELDYGRTMESYQGILEDGGRTIPAEFLRVGRVSLYYLTPDGNHAGRWDKAGNRWLPLSKDFIPTLAQGIRVARNQVPADLLSLPVPAPE